MLTKNTIQVRSANREGSSNSKDIFNGIYFRNHTFFKKHNFNRQAQVLSLAASHLQIYESSLVLKEPIEIRGIILQRTIVKLKLERDYMKRIWSRLSIS